MLSNRVDVLNGSAALAWLHIADGPSTTDAIAEKVARVYGRAKSDVASSVAAIVTKWGADGWLNQRQGGSWSIAQMPPDEVGKRNQSCPNLETEVGDGRVMLWQRRLAIGEKGVLLSVWGSSGQALSADIERLRGFLSGISEAVPCYDDYEVSLVFGRNGVAVKTPRTTQVFPTFVEASASLNSELLRGASVGRHGFTTLHAAAISRELGTILMPAVSGSGKTTLTAYLVNRGWRYGGDDVVGISRSGSEGSMELLPYPTALGIKDGSVSILEDDYPHIHNVPPITYGQKSARFVPVDVSLWTPDVGCWRHIRALVFPAYRAGAKCELQEATQEESLRAILESGTGTYAKAEKDRFEMVFELIRVTPGYRLCYSDLAEANRRLASLIS